jgi:hypothetical protein
MLHNRNFPQGTSDATASAYFLYGIESGLLPWDIGKEWAFDAIGERDQPSIEIIDVATASQRQTAIESLSALAAGADLIFAGRLLLATLHDQLQTGSLSLRAALRIAMHIVFSTSPRSQAYYDFDMLDDDLNLAESGIYGTVGDGLANMLCTLSSPEMERPSAT